MFVENWGKKYWYLWRKNSKVMGGIPKLKDIPFNNIWIENMKNK